MYEKYCDECDEPFEAIRYSKRFCSGKCRVKSHRREKKRRREIDALGATDKRLVDHRHNQRLETIACKSRLAWKIIKRLEHETNAVITERAIDACYELLLDTRQV